MSESHNNTQRFRPAAFALIGFLVAVFIGVLVAMLAQTLTLSRTVKDCTEPGGRCYNEARAQRLETVVSINEVTLAAASCAAANTDTWDEPTYDAIYACVMKALADNPKDPS